MSRIRLYKVPVKKFTDLALHPVRIISDRYIIEPRDNGNYDVRSRETSQLLLTDVSKKEIYKNYV